MELTAAATWVASVVAVGGRRDAAETAAAELAQRYGEAHRRYHTADHVDAVVRDCALLGAELRLSSSDRVLVALAACAHDVVYDARPGEDERASAEWARTWLTRATVVDRVAERVADLVLATATHVARPDDVPAAVLLDADLAVLGASPANYARYVAAVRQEYAAVSDTDWRSGRARVLGALIGRPRLYVTEPASVRWEEPARRNVAAELAGLER
jgi:predicted metal-dependent HD superfamily phosphohydrolase